MGKIKPVKKYKIQNKTKRNLADKIAREFANSVRKKLENHVKEIILFGSRARGDFTEGSDYDILIVVDKRDRQIQEIILDESAEIMDKYDALIGYIVCDEDEWEKKKKFPIGLNILKEGIEI
ncbi:MAG: nucleotidyltransferase domain-containing protein [Candidatus Brocadia sp.]|jgi:Nucleotidyltransferase domain.|uniref:Nucleotidyltransferase domain protein n=1 Tax=Candidatus Brocadia fulgida TaxID=380242 RepID=A0A0M2UWM1_9BACT|nr:MAG: Nucleotidyltransferase domain protein [Candidatus Brocadia fulgida]MCC6325306.1 nucleotidyltransferase domain-containing protein [Candidatus Brocadia sp.]MCE7912330.1 nucleotidyltransferase domain-containing protein [Candidatus Brocadia sp. AMX3]OQZ00855.1 MAG: hypothetical protein B6D35_05075 [Candidatus Brocadia sp. UTAMX2]MBV6519741.1 hypothetical protein [Candidatus Brocadia fulgida]